MLRNIISNDFFTITCLISLVIITITKLIAPKRFDYFTLIIANNKYLKIYSREQKFLNVFDSLLFINLILSLTVFCLIVLRHTTETTNISVNLLFKIAFGIGVFSLIKVLLERLISSILEIDKLITPYLFQKISYKNYLGLFLLPINALLVFTQNSSINIFYIIITVLITTYIIGIITSFKTHQNLIKHNFLYFILYLCTLEISPCIILYKVFIAK